jgi:hypothetical protein
VPSLFSATSALRFASLQQNREREAKSLPIVAENPLRDAARLFRSRRFYHDFKCCLDAVGQLSIRFHTNARSNIFTRANRSREANAVEPIIDGPLHLARQLNRLAHEMAQQRKSEKTVRDGCAIRRLAPRALRIDVNPLAIFSRLGELLNALLCHSQPARHTDFSPREFFQRFQGFENQRWHGFQREAGGFEYFANSNFAMLSVWTSSGPSARRSARASAQASARNVSEETPAPPCA